MCREKHTKDLIFWVLIILIPAYIYFGSKPGPERARQILEKWGFPFTADHFVRSAYIFNNKALELFLIAGMDPDAVSQSGKTALQQAALKNNAQAIKLLLDYGANPHLRNQQGHTALDIALARKNAEATKTLLSCINKPDIPEINLAFLKLTSAGDTQMVQAMLDGGVDPGKSAMVQGAGNTEIINVLAANGGDINAQDSHGRTALMLAARGEGCQMVLVTSSVPEEGKTTISFNLAKTMAAAGDRVLVIDGDLRKPRLHRLMQVKNTRGLTSLVLGEGRFEEVVHRRADFPNLDLITSGALPSNPPELFGKESFQQLIEEAKKRYDWIIIDTPPVATVTDPVIASQFVDMVLLVVKYGGVRRQIVLEGLKALARGQARVVGVALNSVDFQRDYYYNNYYYYSYHDYGEAPGQTAKA